MQRFATDVLFLLNKENSNCSLGTSQVTSGLLLDTVRISAQVLKCSESASSTVWLQINPRGRWRKKKPNTQKTRVTNALSKHFFSFQRLSKSSCSAVSIQSIPGTYETSIASLFSVCSFRKVQGSPQQTASREYLLRITNQRSSCLLTVAVLNHMSC